MLSSEAIPFSKSGGLADVASSLSIALAQLGQEVNLFLPLYGSTDESEFTPVEAVIEIPFDWGVETVRFLYKDHHGIGVYVASHPWFTQRIGIYGPSPSVSYADNLLRYTLLSKAALQMCKIMEWKPDLLHGHDWTAGFLALLARQDEFFAQSKTLFSIHNLGYQGEFPRLDALLAKIPYDPLMFSGKGVNKQVNMMQAALKSYDGICTVSPTYAKEIQSPEYGCSLDHIIRKRKDVLCGILNGIDTTEWDPKTDVLLDHHYSSDDLSGKAKLKAQMQQRFNLAVDPQVPVIGMISRLVEQKGFVELLQGSPSALEQMLTDFHVQFIIVGTGDKGLEEKLATLGELHDNLSVNLIFNNEAAHLVEAGSDFFLMPSRYEPCGLNQMYSLRYGTIPIARRTGGLSDSIIDITLTEGTGILFDEARGSAIYHAVKRALLLYNQGENVLNTIRKRGMETDVSWEHSAQSYLNVYSTLLKR